jgi:hypothetical protein
MDTNNQNTTEVPAWWDDLDYGERMSVLERVWGRQLGQAVVASNTYRRLHGLAKRSVDVAYKELWASAAS